MGLFKSPRDAGESEEVRNDSIKFLSVLWCRSGVLISAQYNWKKTAKIKHTFMSTRAGRVENGVIRTVRYIIEQHFEPQVQVSVTAPLDRSLAPIVTFQTVAHQLTM